MSMMEPAMRAYLTTMREQAFIDIKPGYSDTGASSNETKPIYSAYTPPSPKKKEEGERTRFRESTITRERVKEGQETERVSEASMKPRQKGKDPLWPVAHRDSAQCAQAAIGDAERGSSRKAA